MNDITEQDIIWAAGLIDGEGCISTQTNKPAPYNNLKYPCHSLVLDVGMAHKPTIIRLTKIFGTGNIKTEIAKSGRTIWRISIRGSKRVYDILQMIKPYCFTKINELKLAEKIFLSLQEWKWKKGSNAQPQSVRDYRDKLVQDLKDAKRINWEDTR